MNKLKRIIEVTFFSFVCFACLYTFGIFASASVKSDTFYDNNTSYGDVYSISYSESDEFTGEKMQPAVSLYYGSGTSKVLVDKSDYVVSVGDALYPGSYYCTVTPSENSNRNFYYSFYYTITFDSSKLSIADISSRTFTGSEIKPTVKVYYGTKRLSSSCYYVYYNNNICAGTAEACVEMGYNFNYASLSKQFAILKAKADKLTFGDISAVTYSGYEKCPSVKITYNGNRLYEYSDYSLSYKNNINAGTASATVTLRGNYSGKKTLYFTINKLPASKVRYDKPDTYEYTGSKIQPYLYLYTSDGKYFEKTTDYTVSYSDNKLPGKAKAVVTFKNPNISGTKTIYFNIAIGSLYYASGTESGGMIHLSWYDYNNYSSYKVYKYDTVQKKYVLLKSVKTESFDDKDIKEFKTYKYKIRAYKVINGKTYYGPYSEVSVKTGLFAPSSVKLTTGKDSISVSWSKNSKADGYYVYRYDNEKGTKKLLKKTTSNTTLKYTDTSVINYRPYYYYVISYKKDGTKTVKSSESVWAYSLDAASVTRGASLKSKTSFKVYDTQGSTTVFSRYEYLSDADIATLKKFAASHFTNSMTSAEKVRVTLDWIHSQVTYASADADWNKICYKTYVDAIFNYKLGQCAQYNGALAAMMTYLGYDVQFIRGYRQSSSGYKNQHFWTECKINGLTYVMECGNKKDGAWHYYFQPYKFTSGYTKNGKYISGY